MIHSELNKLWFLLFYRVTNTGITNTGPLQMREVAIVWAEPLYKGIDSLGTSDFPKATSPV